MNNLQTIGVIRDRGQLTIPDEIRQKTEWVSSKSVVTIQLEATDKIVITPVSKHTINWDSLWNSIHYVRLFKGKKGALSKFIVHDREGH